jgi:polysaccharide export outer membrane protein
LSRIPSNIVAAGAAAAMLSCAGIAGAQPVAPAPVVAAAAAKAAAPVGASDASYALGAGDVIDVTLVGRSDYTAHAKVQADGTVLLPLIGAERAVGSTPAQLADSVRAALQKGGFFPDPEVHVEVAQVSSRYVTVLGFVPTPGLIALDRDYRLSELIARVGGRGNGGADYVQVTHHDGTSQRYSLAELATAGGDKDPLVLAGDKIYVPAAENEVFYLTGQVKSPGAYAASADLTLRMALARAGGVTDNGSEKRVKIVRRGEPVKDVKIDVTKVEAGDVISVGERLF